MNNMDVLVALSSIILCGCAGQKMPSRPAVGQSAVATPSPTSAFGYVETAASLELFELNAATLALNASTNRAVSSYAVALIQQHSVTSDRLRLAAEAEGYTFPTLLRPQEQLRMVQLRSAGLNFDPAFREALIIVHQQQIALHQNYARLGSLPLLRNIAAAAVPLARQHLGAAYALRTAPSQPAEQSAKDPRLQERG